MFMLKSVELPGLDVSLDVRRWFGEYRFDFKK